MRRGPLKAIGCIVVNAEAGPMRFLKTSQCLFYSHRGATVFPNPRAADKALRATEEEYERRGWPYDPEEWDVVPLLPMPDAMLASHD